MANLIPTTEAPAPAPAHTPYFVYGSLMSPTILFSVIGGYSPLTPKILKATRMKRSTLHGYRRHAVKYADFPAVVKTGNPEDFVEGYLVTGLTEYEEKRIEAFESGLYTDEDVEVLVENKKAAARIYVWAGTLEQLMDVEVREWSWENFKMSKMYLLRVIDEEDED